MGQIDLPVVKISRRASKQLGAGRLWVYSNEVESQKENQAEAYWCHFLSGGKVLGTGYFNKHSLIAGRLVSFERVTDIPRLLETRLREAFTRRLPLANDGALRLVFSEADMLPGLIVDGYFPYVVIQSNTAGMDLMLPTLEEYLPKILKEMFGLSLQGLVFRCDSEFRKLEGVDIYSRVCFGDEERMSRVEILEKGVRYLVDLLRGQKTGFFIDQRENRFFLGEILRERSYATLLDLYCYSGGWGLRAMRQGAENVTFVDQSAEALALLEQEIALNGMDQRRARILKEDVFHFLVEHTETYDVVVVDPPAFAKSKRALPQAIKAYQKLNRLAWRRVREGGVLLTSSCSHHVTESDFMGLLRVATEKENGLAHVIYQGRQAQDHPVLLSMPETAYLKCTGLLKIHPKG